MGTEFALIVAVSTTLLSMLVKVVGLPDQIRKNYQRKSTDGLSRWFVIISFWSYVLWTLHGMLQHDLSLIVGQGLGVITTGILMAQVAFYRRPKHPDR